MRKWARNSGVLRPRPPGDSLSCPVFSSFESCVWYFTSCSSNETSPTSIFFMLAWKFFRRWCRNSNSFRISSMFFLVKSLPEPAAASAFSVFERRSMKSFSMNSATFSTPFTSSRISEPLVCTGCAKGIREACDSIFLGVSTEPPRVYCTSIKPLSSRMSASFSTCSSVSDSASAAFLTVTLLPALTKS